MFRTSRRRIVQALGLGGAASLAGCSALTAPGPSDSNTTTQSQAQTKEPTVDRVAADPADIPDPVDWDSPRHHEIEFEVTEVVAEVEPGVTFTYMTFDGQIPGPMVRVRQGDTISFNLKNLDENKMPHNVDFHAIHGTGGGSIATTAAPGESNAMKFKAMYPGAFIYHCAVPNMDHHISSGMFGMIVVEPPEGLPEVDREFYFGQHELYTDKQAGEEGHHKFDFQAMLREDPTYVLLNGEKYAWAAPNYGPLEADLGDRIRIFFATGGPNLTSSFHPIGNVFDEAYRDGGWTDTPDRNIQTMSVPPGSCMIGEMDTYVPSRIKLVDHALTRVLRKGLLAEIDVTGEKQYDVFDPEPDGPDEGPIYGDSGE